MGGQNLVSNCSSLKELERAVSVRSLESHCTLYSYIDFKNKLHMLFAEVKLCRMSRVTRPNWVFFGEEQVKATLCSPTLLLDPDNTEFCWVCPHCLDSCATQAHLASHIKVCSASRPVGSEIYREGPLSFFMVSGSSEEAKRISRVGKAFIPVQGGAEASADSDNLSLSRYLSFFSFT